MLAFALFASVATRDVLAGPVVLYRLDGPRQQARTPSLRLDAVGAALAKSLSACSRTYRRVGDDAVIGVALKSGDVWLAVDGVTFLHPWAAAVPEAELPTFTTLTGLAVRLPADGEAVPGAPRLVVTRTSDGAVADMPVRVARAACPS